MRAGFRFGYLAALFLFLAAPAMGQQKAAPVQQPTTRDELLAQIKKLDWKPGPTQGSIAGIATIVVPQGSVFLGAVDARRFLELLGNLAADNTFIFAPNDVGWFSVFSFDPSGYVPDDEKIDPDALLDILKKNNAAGDEERKQRGFRPLVLEDWHVVPHYDVQTKRLEWGTRLREASGGITVNYAIRLLGRTGVVSAILVSDPTSLDQDIKSFKTALAGFDFNSGQRYLEYRTGDKVAEYGLAALIVGGTAAAAVKSGAFKVFEKFIVFGVFGCLAAAWAALRSFFSRKRAEPDA
jgi:uncharacterized membrane-anchored protein